MIKLSCVKRIVLTGVFSMTLLFAGTAVGAKKVAIINCCEHEFSMTVVNDAQGFIYSAIKSYIEYDSYNHYSSS